MKKSTVETFPFVVAALVCCAYASAKPKPQAAAPAPVAMPKGKTHKERRAVVAVDAAAVHVNVIAGMKR